MQLTSETKQKYTGLFDSLAINPARRDAATTVAKFINAYRERYETVCEVTGVPWFLIGILHERESGGVFGTYLGDGEPLDHPTHNVPHGRGPFASFEVGAIDALQHEGFDKVADWSLGSILWHMEAFNGFGYANKGLLSPYVWAGSNHYTVGKYDVDGHYNPSLIDKQLGGAVMLAALMNLGFVDLQSSIGALSLTQSVSQPDKGKPMATTTTTVLSNPADAVIAAAQGALVDLKALAGSVAGALGSGVIATGAGLATTLMPTLSGEIAMGLVAFGGVLSAVVHGLIAMHLTSIANNATLLSVEKALNTTVTALGEPAISFENLAAAISPATA